MLGGREGFPEPEVGSDAKVTDDIRRLKHICEAHTPLAGGHTAAAGKGVFKQLTHGELPGIKTAGAPCYNGQTTRIADSRTKTSTEAEKENNMKLYVSFPTGRVKDG